MEREVGGDGPWPECSGIFFFIDQFDSADPDAIVIEVEFLGIVHRMSDFDFMADIGWRDLIDSALKADGGIVIDQTFVSDEEDLVEFGPGKPADGNPFYGGIVSVNGPFTDAVMELVMVVFLKPEPKGLIEFVQGDALLDSGEESLSDGAEKSLHFAS